MRGEYKKKIAVPRKKYKKKPTQRNATLLERGAMSLEASSLLRDGDNSLPGTKAVSGRHMAPRRRVFVASVSLAVSVILLCGAITWKTKAKTFDENNPLAFAGESLAWVAHNKYTKEHGFVGLDYPWLNLGSLAEPHVKTTLRVFNSNKDVKCSYKWQFLGQTGEGISLDVVSMMDSL